MYQITVLLGFGLIGLGGCTSTVGHDVPGIVNFDELRDAPQTIYRGAQPSEEGIQWLAGEKKVATVIDLRDDAKGWEGSAVVEHRMSYKRIPTNASVIDPARINEFLSTVTSAKGPVFVHCKEGKDRTGLEIAMYRVVCQDWDRERAIRELREHGYNHFWFPQIERFVRHFDARDFPKPHSVTASTASGH